MTTSTSPSKGIALITGASTGIGAVYADRLAKRGHDLVLVARDRQRLDKLAQRLIAETGRTVEVVVADLTNRADLARVEARLRSDSQITVLINNAGMATMQPLATANIEDSQRLIDLNITAFTRVATAAAPTFAARGSGTIINIASIVALAPELISAVYSASKAYVLAFTQSMQHELGAKGIQVQAVLPGATRTEIWERAGTHVDQLPQEIVMPVDEMVDAALAGLDQGELITIPSLPDDADWARFDAARLALGPNLSRNTAATRYKAA
jgi:hypothetical protein